MDTVMEIATFAVDEEPNPLEIPVEDSDDRWPLLGSFGDDKPGLAQKWEGEMTEREFERGMNAVAELQDL